MNQKPNAVLTLMTVLFITATVAFAAFIRSVRVSDSLWVDELHTSWTVSSTFSDITVRAARGNQSPLYFWIQWLVQSVFGHSETTLRAVSWISGLLFVIVIVFAARGLTRSRTAACTAGLLIAVDSNLVFYANEARPYALLQLVGTLSALACFTYATTGTVKSRCAWIALATASCYLHYTAGLLIAGEATYLVCRRLTSGRLNSISNETSGNTSPKTISFKQIFFDMLIVAALLTPSLPHLFDIAERRANWAQFISQQDVFAIFSVLPTTRPMVVALACAAVAVAVTLIRRTTRSGQISRIQLLTPFIAFAACWFLVPTIIAFALNNTDLARVFIRRYLVAMIPGTYLLMASFISVPASRGLRFAVASIVLAFGLFQSPILRFEAPYLVVARHSNEDWRSAIFYLNAITQPKLVFMRAGLIEDDYLKLDKKREEWREYSQLPIAGIYALNRESTAVISLPYSDSGNLNEPTVQLLQKQDEAWFLLRGRVNAREAAITAVIESVEGQFRIESERSFGPTLALYQIVKSQNGR